MTIWCFSFFFLKGYEENLPVTIGFLKVSCVWNHFCNTCGRTFPEGSCHSLPHRPFELEVPGSPSGQVVVTGNVHKVAASLHALQPEP